MGLKPHNVMNAKSHPEVRLDKLIISWQGWQSVKITFDQDLEKIDTQEISKLLSEDVIEGNE